MRETNIQFQEQYKQLDKLCKEMYSNREGVSAYIQDMDNTPFSERNIVYNWDYVYKQLKHARYMRNQLAHEIDIDTEFCTQDDVDWVRQFYESIFHGTDPLACVYKVRKQSTVQDVRQHSTVINPTSYNSAQKKPKKSIWNRIVSKIKSWFS